MGEYLVSNSVTLGSFNGSAQALKADANNTLNWRGKFSDISVPLLQVNCSTLGLSAA